MVNRSYLGYYDLKYTLGVVIIQASRGSIVSMDSRPFACWILMHSGGISFL